MKLDSFYRLMRSSAFICLLLVSIPSYSNECLSGNCQDGFGRSSIFGPGSNMHYEGQFKNGKPHGKGALLFTSESPESPIASVEGVYQNGYQVDGPSAFVQKDGIRIERLWKNNDYVGPAKVFLADGTIVYEGEINSLLVRDGIGKKYYSNGDVFEGEWKMGDRVKGTVIFANGNRYVGEFSESAYPLQNAPMDEEGDRKVKSQGTLYNKDGRILYEGQYLNDKKHGTGTLYLENNNSFVGGFEDGEQNGSGKYILADGREIEVVFSKGKNLSIRNHALPEQINKRRELKRSIKKNSEKDQSPKSLSNILYSNNGIELSYEIDKRPWNPKDGPQEQTACKITDKNAAPAEFSKKIKHYWRLKVLLKNSSGCHVNFNAYPSYEVEMSGFDHFHVCDLDGITGGSGGEEAFLDNSIMNTGDALAWGMVTDMGANSWVKDASYGAYLEGETPVLTRWKLGEHNFKNCKSDKTAGNVQNKRTQTADVIVRKKDDVLTEGASDSFISAIQDFRRPDTSPKTNAKVNDREPTLSQRNSNETFITSTAENMPPSGIYALCSTAKVNRYTSDRACHQYYFSDEKWCSDPAGQICVVTGETRADLCVRTGKASGIPLVDWNSGYGTFDSREACLKACNSKTVIDFGGKCFGVLP